MSYNKAREDIWTKYRSRVVYVTILVVLALLYVLDVNQLDLRSIKIIPTMKIITDNGFVIKTSGCRIPYMDPFDKLVKKYIQNIKPLNCSSQPPLISSNLTWLYVVNDALPFYNITDLESLECCYEPFWRVDPPTNLADNLYEQGPCIYFYNSTEITDEFVKVNCKVSNTLIYKDYHFFVPEKKNQMTEKKRSKKFDSSLDKMNILIIGLDSISRLNFQRQMPLTARFLQEELNVIELLGYNKVGDNTFPNLIPILTGLSETELKNLCWPTTHTKFDDCPFIWKNYSQAGYTTVFAEDASWMGVFNYVKRGFHHQPTDYYWKTFNYLAEKDIGHSKHYNAVLCVGPKPVYVLLLEYILKFVSKMKDKPFFSFFWGTSLSHDDLNYPSLGDKDYNNLFHQLKESNILNKSVLIILSDHGIRWGDIRSTHQGHLEERLPFVFFSFPKWFSEKYPTAIANLRRNTRRLTTPYDIHETLLDVLNIQRLIPNNIKSRMRNEKETSKRGVSLFLHVPETRTCLTAGIEAHWCTCQKSVEVQISDPTVSKVAQFIVDHMNFLLTGYKACSPLHLDTIKDARLLKTEDYLKNNLTIHDYTLIIKTKPGGGLFEATVRCIYCQKFDTFNLTGTVSRINLYGEQSACITDFHLKLYCYCGG